MSRALTDGVQRVARRVGIQIRRLSRSFEARNARLLNHFGIELVIDVGANRGQYGQGLREYGFKGSIVSFEPLREPFRELLLRAEQDARWQAERVALGSERARRKMNVSQNSASSSLLPVTEASVKAEPVSAAIAEEEVQIELLDDVIGKYLQGHEKIALKIDAQGYEWEVLSGAARLLSSIQVLHLEMSLHELYRGQKLFADLDSFLRDAGFTLVAVGEQFFSMDTGFTLSVDCSYARLPDRATGPVA